MLITSGEHCGAIINKGFDYTAYLDTLAMYGLNYTRIYPGEMIESFDRWIKGNMLGVPTADLFLPWTRSNVKGYTQGGNKFDLDQWNEVFFIRLNDFISKAKKRGIVVEICFFDGVDQIAFDISPFNVKNNIQGIY